MKTKLPVLSIAGLLMMGLAGCAKPAAAVSSPTPIPSTPTPIPASPTPSSPFAYDAAVPFDVKVNSETEQAGVTVTDLSYSAHDPLFSQKIGGRTLAYVVKPKGDGPFAGVIYLHWFGQNTSNREEFLDEAIKEARQGVVCLLLQGYFPWMVIPTATETDRQLITGQVIELRRAIDFLLTQQSVDPNRLGFVGHDYGAMYGGILAGIDPRLKTFVLVTGAPSFADWITYFGSDFQREKYLPLVQDLDPIRYVSKASPSSIFFQFAKLDAVLPAEKANSLYEAAREPKKIAWYDDIHSMRTEEVGRDRADWLAQQLDLPSSPNQTVGN